MKRPKPARIVIRKGDKRTPWRAEVYDSAGNLRSMVPVPGVADPHHYTREYIDRWISDYFPGLPIEEVQS